LIQPKPEPRAADGTLRCAGASAEDSPFAVAAIPVARIDCRGGRPRLSWL